MAGRRVAVGVGAVVLVVLMLVAAAVGVAWWALGTAAGTARLVGWIPNVAVTKPSGSLLGDFSAEQIEIALPGHAGTLRLDAPRWTGLTASRGSDGRWLHIVIEALHADRAVLVPSKEPAPATTEPAKPPQSLRLPLEIEVGSLTVGELFLGEPASGSEPGVVPIRDIRARLHVGADGGALHTVDDASAVRDKARIAGALRIAADPPFDVDSKVRAESIANVEPSWQADATATGPLDALRVDAAARVQPSSSHPPQSLDAKAVLHPFAAWPLGELSATTSALDLSAFAKGLPATAISGKATAETRGSGEPAQVMLDLANAKAGRWNEGLLPVTRVNGDLRAKPDDPGRLELSGLVAELGSASAPGGTVRGSGRWAPEGFELDVTLAAISPAALDARAPPQRLDGTVTATGSGFTGTATRQQVDLKAAIKGSVSTSVASKPVRLDVDATWALEAGTTTVEVRRAEASSGAATAVVKATATQRGAAAAATSPWIVRGDLRLAAFDPIAWWPGAGTAWQAGPNRVDAQGRFDVTIPATLPQGALADVLAALRGSADVTLAPSTLAGVAVEGKANYANASGIADASADLVAGGNRVKGSGRFDASAAKGDAWQVAIDAPQLDRLAPLARALGVQAAGNPPLTGAITGQARVDGRWPGVQTSGDLKATSLRYGALSLADGQARWALGTEPGSKLSATLAARDLRSGDASIERVDGELAGTASAHRLTLRAESKALPPEWVDAVQSTGRNAMPAASAAVAAAAPPSTAAAPSGARSVVAVEAEGGLVFDAGSGVLGATGWKGVLQRAEVARLAAPQSPWLSARDVRGTVKWGDAGTRIALEPGSATVLGAAVKWSEASWRSAAAATGPGSTAAAGPRIDLQARIDPIPVAPVLAALQPDFGWNGDLRIGATIDVRSVPRPSADIVVERVGGDLSIRDESGYTQSLGLTDLRLGIAAQDGVWNFTQAIAGKTLGVGVGAVVARTGNPAAWPDAQTPIEGVFQLDVANLGTWGTWVPAGWRLGGKLAASASIGGRLGAPEYTGRIDGSGLSVRNFVQGVSVTDGEVAIALKGTTATIERFTAKAGSGTARLEGDAKLGASPVARLRLILDRFQALGRVDRRIVASGTAALQLDAKRIALDGKLGVDEGLVDFTRADAPSLSDDVEVVRRKGDDPRVKVAADTGVKPPAPKPAASSAISGPAKAAPPVAAASAAAAPLPDAVQRKVALDLRVNLGEKLRIRGRGLDAALRGELHITSPGGVVTVGGTVRTVDGTYQAYGQKLTIDRGIVAFTGDVGNPRLDIEATRPNLDVRVGVAVTGNVQNPRIRLFSEPEMADIDKLSWLVLGRANDSVGRTDTALLQRAALALLSGEGPGVTDRITKALGLDDISVRQGEGQNNVQDTFIGLGKQLSKNWYIGYEQGLKTATGSWQLIYRLARRLTVRAQAGGDNAIDLIWTIRWK